MRRCKGYSCLGRGKLGNRGSSLAEAGWGTPQGAEARRAAPGGKNHN